MSLFDDNCVTTKFSDISKNTKIIWEGIGVENVAAFLRNVSAEDILMDLEIGCDYTTRFKSRLVNEKLEEAVRVIMRTMRGAGLEPTAVMNKCKKEIIRQYDEMINSLLVTCEGESEVNINVYSYDRPVLKITISDDGKKRRKR